MRLASIDIGTNTILLLIADFDSVGKLTVVRDMYSFPRLGRGVDEKGVIASESLTRAFHSLAEYKKVLEDHQCHRIFACGTSALRDASNSEEFLAWVKTTLGLEIRILSGEEEAELTYRGAVSEFMLQSSKQEYAVLDIGGGSTELTVGVDGNFRSRTSLNIGCVRLTERYLKDSPPARKDLEGAQDQIRKSISSLQSFFPQTDLIGVAGTLTTLAALDLRLERYDPNRISGHVLTRERIKGIFQELSVKSYAELESIPQILKGRADVLLAGILILLEVMRHLRTEQIRVSDRGLRFGILIEAIDELWERS